MKKILITSFAVAAMAIGGGIFVHTALIGSDPILEANVEALTRGEANVEALTRGEDKADGALWSNPQGTAYCCGPGNVRDCDNTPVPKC